MYDRVGNVILFELYKKLKFDLTVNAQTRSHPREFSGILTYKLIT